MKNLVWVAMCLCLFPACSATKHVHGSAGIGEIIQEGLINCFDTTIVDNKNTPINCEASAVFFGNGSLIIAEDKEISQNGLSPVFSIPLTGSFPPVIAARSVTYLTAESFLKVRKIEGMTKEPYGDLCFATTDFEWITDKPAEADAFNSVLCWKDGNYNSIAYVNETNDGGVKSSKSLRTSFLAALRTSTYPEGPPYFKVESICALPDSILLFGIREIGASWEHPEYTFIVLSTKYHVVGGRVVLDAVFKKSYEKYPWMRENFHDGLSSITYNKFRKEIYFSSSVEKFSNTDSVQFGAYLWSLSLKKFYAHKPPTLLKDKSGQIIKLKHKVEGITFVSKDTLFTVSDQDRLLNWTNAAGAKSSRKSFQAVYSIIKIR